MWPYHISTRRPPVHFCIEPYFLDGMPSEILLLIYMPNYKPDQWINMAKMNQSPCSLVVINMCSSSEKGPASVFVQCCQHSVFCLVLQVVHGTTNHTSLKVFFFGLFLFFLLCHFRRHSSYSSAQQPGIYCDYLSGFYECPFKGLHHPLRSFLSLSTFLRSSLFCPETIS